jgi:ketosteroid isomerase-like protein
MSLRPVDVVRACLEAYAAKDRKAIEALVAEDYHFTSPWDNALDRDAYSG